MKAKIQAKPKKTSKLVDTRIMPLDFDIAKTVIHHGNKFFTKLAEKSGIPQGYSGSVAWFAERLVLASVCLIAISFAGGAMFVLYASEPIAESQFYDVVSNKARLAEQGIKVYSQQVIDVASPIFGKLVHDNRKEIDLQAEKIAIRIEKLRAYLKDKKSPFADDEEALKAFAESNNMNLMVAISFVESTFGQHCYYFNCSGIGGTPPNLRKYNSYAEWIKDFDQLLERRYKDIPPEKFVGLYVQPGSPNWIFGVKQVIREFEELQIEG